MVYHSVACQSTIYATEAIFSRMLRDFTSNGGCRREEKIRKHWSLFTMLLTSVTKIFPFSVRSNQKQLYVLIALKIREK